MAAAGGFDAASLVASIESQQPEPGQPDAEVQQVEGPIDVDPRLAPVHVSLGLRQWVAHPELTRESEKLSCLDYLLSQAESYDQSRGRRAVLSQLIEGVHRVLGNNPQGHGSVELDRNELVRRMLLDGCYIVKSFANWPPRVDDNGGGAVDQLAGEAHNGHVDDNVALIGDADNHHRPVHCFGLFGLVSSCCKGWWNNHNAVVGCPDLELGRSSSQENHHGLCNNVGLEVVSGRGDAVDDRTRESLWRDTWFLVDNRVPYDVVAEINQLIYGPSNMVEGLRAEEAAQRLLESWGLYAPSQVPPQRADSLLGLFADLLKPKDPNSSLRLNNNYGPICFGGGAQKKQDGAERRMWQWLRATEYIRRCNVRFVVSPLDGTDRRSVLDVTATVSRFFRSILVRAPHLHINKHMLVLLRNLVELEQRDTSTQRRRHVTAYCYFMYKLASQPADVEFLQREGIIDHAYNDPMEVVTGLRDVVGGASVTDYDYLQPIAQELGRRFYDNTVHWRLSWLRVSYWNRADIVALIAAIFTLVTIFLAVPGLVHG